MKLISDPTAASVDKKTLTPENIDLYEEDLTGDSIDNWLRNKVVTLKLIN